MSLFTLFLSIFFIHASQNIKYEEQYKVVISATQKETFSIGRINIDKQIVYVLSHQVGPSTLSETAIAAESYTTLTTFLKNALRTKLSHSCISPLEVKIISKEKERTDLVCQNDEKATQYLKDFLSGAKSLLKL